MLAGRRAGQALVAVGVGAVFVLELVGAAGGDLLAVQVAGDGVVAQAGGGGDQRPGQGGAVPAALDQQRSLAVCLDAELVGAVVHDGVVAERAGGEVEALGQGLGIGAVVAEPAGLVAAGGHGGQDPGAGAAGVLAGPGQCQADGEIRMRRRRAGRPGRGGDGGLQRPGDFLQRLAFVVLAFAVIAFADVPAAVGIAGRQAGAPGRAAGEQRDRGGVQAGAAVVCCAFFAGQDTDAGFDQCVDERLQPAAGGLGLGRCHRPGAGLEVRFTQPPVFRQRRGVHDRADGAEAVADPAAGGQEGPLGGGGASHAEQPAGGLGKLAEQQPGCLGQEQRPVIQGQAQQRGEHGADRQRAGPPGAVGQRGLDHRGLAGAVDELGSQGDRRVADAVGGGQGQASGVHWLVSARQRARRAPLDGLMPATWRA